MNSIPQSSSFKDEDRRFLDGMFGQGTEYDVFPSIHDLFFRYNTLYFEERLGSVTVEWSSKMTHCAGLCYYHRQTGSCSIKLSELILKFRPVKDLKDTLLHEMIHAYLFIVTGTIDRDGHGPDFQVLMNTINAAAKANITIYHSFHEEVNYYKKHVWRCTGMCQEKPPFYGWVRRSINRAPQLADYWFKAHLEFCGGTFVKVLEPSKSPNSKLSENNSKANAVGGYGPGRVLGSHGNIPAFREKQIDRLNGGDSQKTAILTKNEANQRKVHAINKVDVIYEMDGIDKIYLIDNGEKAESGAHCHRKADQSEQQCDFFVISDSD